MDSIETSRLQLRPLVEDDAAFVFRLVNDPAWLRFVGDRGVRTLEDARAYIRKGAVAMQAQPGFGLYLVELKATGAAVGSCGLFKREALTEVDIGFAFLAEFRGQGYAHEAAVAMLAHGRDRLGLKRIAAIVSPDNVSSIRLLEKLGLRYEKAIRLPGENADVSLFAVEFGSSRPI